MCVCVLHRPAERAHILDLSSPVLNLLLSRGSSVFSSLCTVLYIQVYSTTFAEQGKKCHRKGKGSKSQISLGGAGLKKVQLTF